MRAAALRHFTELGIPGLSWIPYGVHFCHFYPSKDDLIRAVVPYFVAGLRNNERCIWITAHPFPAHEAREEIAKVMPEAAAAIRDGLLRILCARQWYGRCAAMSADDVVGLWLKEEEAALAAGLQGLRVAGDTSFLTPETWGAFMKYEGAVANAFNGRRIIALCSYDVHQWKVEEITEAMRHHQFTLVRPYENETWHIVPSPAGGQ
jgi:hypothetical protein